MFPKIEINKHAPLQDYYCDGYGNEYSVARIIDEAKDLEAFDCPLASLDLSYRIWRDSDIIEMAEHVKRVNESGLDNPIILDWSGAIADGRHRVIKALVEGKSTIKAVRLKERIHPCRVED